MGQTARTAKLLLDLSTRDQGGTNPGKRSYLTETVIILNAARRFFLDFFLAHPDKLMERVEVISKKTGEVREGVISADTLLTWAEFQTVETPDHPTPLPDWNFSRAFPDLPNRYRRSVIKDVIGKARGYLTSVTKWHASGKKKGKPGIPTASNHPTLYAGTFSLDLDELDLRKSFIRLKVYTGSEWVWVHYPTCYNRYFERRRAEPGWETESPKLILGKQSAAIHFLQTKTIFERLRKIKPSGGSKSRRLNRKQANQLKGKINQLAKEKAYAIGVVSVEVNPHGTSQYCARCGRLGVRFTYQAGQRVTDRGGKLFYCPSCHYECHADFNASVNVHHSFFREFHWQPRERKSG